MKEEQFDPVNIKVGSLLRRVRLMNHITQKEVAAICKTSQSSIVAVEEGKYKMPGPWLIALFDAYSFNPLYILGLSKKLYLEGVQKGYELEDKIPIVGSPKIGM